MAARSSRGPRGRAVDSRAEALGEALFYVTVAASALALGTIHSSVLCVVALALVVATGLIYADAGDFRPSRRAVLLLAIGALLTGYTVLQLVPMPASVVAALSPATGDVWARCLRPLGETGPAFATITLDPVATSTEVLRGLAYVLSFACALRLSRSSASVTRCTWTIIATALLVAFGALLHPVFGLHRVFGVYEPETAIDPRHIAPILNSNALAGYLNIGFVLALGQGLARRARVPRPLSLAAVAMLVAVQLWVASRGGVATMFLGLLLVLVYVKRSRDPRHLLVILGGGALVVAIAAVVVATSDSALGELGQKDVSKLRVFAEVLPMLRTYPLTGVGRGAFESTFPAFRDEPYHYVHTHPENVLLQWGTEWGLPVTFVALLGIVWALRPWSISRGRLGVAAPWIALVVLSVHNLVDFSSELPGPMIALAACAGMVVARTEDDADRAGARRWPRALVLVTIAAALLQLPMVASSIGTDLYADQQRLRNLALSPQTSSAEFETASRAAMLRHPAEPYLPFAGALFASRSKNGSVVPWIERTLERAPSYGPAHVVLGRWLFRRSPAQARLEYRYGFLQAPELVPSVAPEAAPLVTTYDAAIELIPPGAAGIAPLKAFAAMPNLRERLPGAMARLDQDLASRAPEDAEAPRRAAWAALEDLRSGAAAPWCEESPACLAHALSLAERLQTLAPRECDGYRIAAEEKARWGSVPHAIGDLATIAQSLGDRSECLRSVVDVARATAHDELVTDAVDKLVRASCSDSDECLANIIFAARTEQESHHEERALTLWRRARKLAPERDDIVQENAQAASQLGLHVEALDAFALLAKRHPEDPQWRSASERERSALLRRTP